MKPLAGATAPLGDARRRDDAHRLEPWLGPRRLRLPAARLRPRDGLHLRNHRRLRPGLRQSRRQRPAGWVRA